MLIIHAAFCVMLISHVVFVARYLVTNYYSGGSVSAIYRKLHKDTDLNYPPLVGLAMPLEVRM